MSKIKILIVDDNHVTRQLVHDILHRDPQLEVMAAAPNDMSTIETAMLQKPDVITMDIDMPGTNGISAVRELRKHGIRTPVIVYSTNNTTGARSTFQALQNGASCHAPSQGKPTQADESIKLLDRDLIPKIKSLCRRRPPALVPQHPAPRHPGKTTCSRHFAHRPNILCIGSSTGGPSALDILFRGIPANFPVPILLVQHMPPVFTTYLRDSMQKNHALKFFEAETGMPLKAACVYLAPGGKHMEVATSASHIPHIQLTDGPPENFCRPAVDVMLRSVQAIERLRPLTVILTGMGSDGLISGSKLYDAGHPIIAQDESTSAVWGMPGNIVARNRADLVLPIQNIAQAILKFIPCPPPPQSL